MEAERTEPRPNHWYTGEGDDWGETQTNSRIGPLTEKLSILGIQFRSAT